MRTADGGETRCTPLGSLRVRNRQLRYVMTRQEIVMRADIVKLIGSYFPLMKTGEYTYRASCPFHDDPAPSFLVTSERQSYQCLRCGADGDVVDFVKRYEHVSKKRALHMLAQWLSTRRSVGWSAVSASF